jgi:excisionase family DNA binding protein
VNYAPVIERLFTPDEAADALNIHRATIYELLKEGSLVSVKLRGSTRIKATELARFCASLPPAKYDPLGRKQGVRT